MKSRTTIKHIGKQKQNKNAKNINANKQQTTNSNSTHPDQSPPKRQEPEGGRESPHMNDRERWEPKRFGRVSTIRPRSAEDGREKSVPCL
jgi:hypothetical protein